MLRDCLMHNSWCYKYNISLPCFTSSVHRVRRCKAPSLPSYPGASGSALPTQCLLLLWASWQWAGRRKQHNSQGDGSHYQGKCVLWAAACAAMAEPRCKCYRDFQMRINGLSLANIEENVLRVVVYYFCYSHCTCLLLPSVGIKLLALVLSLGCKPFTGRECALLRGLTKAPEKLRCLKSGMPWNQFQRNSGA